MARLEVGQWGRVSDRYHPLSGHVVEIIGREQWPGAVGYTVRLANGTTEQINAYMVDACPDDLIPCDERDAPGVGQEVVIANHSKRHNNYIAVVLAVAPVGPVARSFPACVRFLCYVRTPDNSRLWITNRQIAPPVDIGYEQEY